MPQDGTGMDTIPGQMFLPDNHAVVWNLLFSTSRMRLHIALLIKSIGKEPHPEFPICFNGGSQITAFTLSYCL